MEHSDTRPLWERRFGDVDKDFFEGIRNLEALSPSIPELIHHFPMFTGRVNLARYLALYESFKLVQNLSGHYADVGTWTGASFLFIAKLIKLFEPQTVYQIHAFDWFQGMIPDATPDTPNYVGHYRRLLQLIDLQGLTDVAIVHNIDLTSELPAFGKDSIYGSTYYKYVFMDCGKADVLEKAVPFFWSRLVTGGIMLFDHFATDVQVETEIVRAVLPSQTIFKTFPFSRQPTAYVIKARASEP